MGAGGTELDDLLGPPRLRRLEGPAEVRQYRSPDCVLDAYLYPDSRDGGAHRVTYYEARGRGGGLVDAGDCFAALLRMSHAALEGERQ